MTLTRSMSHAIVLWDIDNTLLYTGGAGTVAMTRAFRDLYGIDDAFGRVEFSGRTDTAIFRDAARAHGITGDLEREQARFMEAYLPHLRAALHEMRGGALMPGVPDVLAALEARDDIVQGLGTGNFRPAGAMKLRHYGIDAYFDSVTGGFGEDSDQRDVVIRKGIERLRHGLPHDARAIVIGDTPHDVAAARANGAFALAVATGRHSRAELAAAGAAAALDDLSDTGHVVALVTGAATPRA